MRDGPFAFYDYRHIRAILAELDRFVKTYGFAAGGEPFHHTVKVPYVGRIY